jgi:hypothetical protein
MLVGKKYVVSLRILDSVYPGVRLFVGREVLSSFEAVSLQLLCAGTHSLWSETGGCGCRRSLIEQDNRSRCMEVRYRSMSMRQDMLICNDICSRRGHHLYGPLRTSASSTGSPDPVQAQRASR